MNDQSLRNPAYLTLTDQQLSEIDALCDRFDQELVNGDGPRIETFIADAPEAARNPHRKTCSLGLMPRSKLWR